MALIILHKNRYIYSIKLKIKRYLYSSPFLFKNYLKLKEIVIKERAVPANRENMLFEKIFVETVSYCNNDCIFCPASREARVKDPSHFMPEDLYMKILNELAGLSYSGSLAFHCNNEPLLDKRLVFWVKTARSLLKNNFFYLYSNGILINLELANQLFEAGLNRIIVDNYNNQHDLIPSVENLINQASFLKGELIISYRHKDEYLGNRAGESSNARVFLKKPLKLICARPLTEMVVGYNGVVPLCCADGLWKITLGNVRNTSLKDVWFSAKFKEIRESLLKGDRSCTEICRVCDALNLASPKGIRV